MKFNCGEEFDEKVQRLSDWHPFFCLLPRKVGRHDCRWLEWIERRGRLHPGCMDGPYWTWEYRPMRP